MRVYEVNTNLFSSYDGSGCRMIAMRGFVAYCYAAFGVTSALTFGLVAATWTRAKGPPASKACKALRKKYLVVYLLAFFADWLQGPYVYALYASYGFSEARIAFLFIAGFGSSAVIGTFAGGLADRVGRRACAVAYCAVYVACCACKHSNAYGACLAGRLLGGVATSLLFSSFEAWCVSAHAKAGEAAALPDLFAAAQFGNGLAAIIAGQLAQAAVDRGAPLTRAGALYYGGDIWPFDLSALALVACGVACVSTWDENYGDRERPRRWRRAVGDALEGRALLCGAASSTFESAMYIFVFLWTPALAGADEPPEGLIFSTFMVCVMGGSCLAKGGGARRFAANSAAAALSLGAAAALDDRRWKLLAFLVFEVCVGCYWPLVGAIKARVVPEESRAAVYSLYRVPLNACVVAVLLARAASRRAQFLVCAGLLAASATAGLALARAERAEHAPRLTGDVAINAEPLLAAGAPR